MRLFALFAASLLAQEPGPSDLNRVAAGSRAPAFSLPSTGGATVSLDQFRGRKVVLVFYRGSW